MRQRWEKLLFLHWEVNPELIQATLPEGLTVDTYEGKAYLGEVPFFMRAVRPAFLPAMPWISDFMECNLRTYVTGPQGPGVWFYSLDCDQPLAVELARGFFHLPYFHAHMHSEVAENGWVNYQSRRHYKRALRSQEKNSAFRYRGCGETREAEVGSLDFFLIERYQLYAASAGNHRLYSGRVWHEPYPISSAEVSAQDQGQLIKTAGFSLSDPEPGLAHYSAGVEVSIFGLNRIK
jgi:hypothetical protein